MDRLVGTRRLTGQRHIIKKSLPIDAYFILNRCPAMNEIHIDIFHLFYHLAYLVCPISTYTGFLIASLQV